MRWTQTLIPTQKETPADAQIVSHQLMLRAGLIRQLQAGAYDFLPLGWRALQKAAQIVREEMDAIGGAEVLLPALQPYELWQKTGRDVSYGENLMKFKDRHGRVNVLGPSPCGSAIRPKASSINSFDEHSFRARYPAASDNTGGTIFYLATAILRLRNSSNPTAAMMTTPMITCCQ